MTPKALAILVLSGFTFLCYAQKNVLRSNQQWLVYQNQLEVSDRTMVFSDISFRRANYFKDWSQITLRASVGRNFKQNIQGFLGIACFTFYAQEKMNRIEFRPYQDVIITQNFRKIMIAQRLRIEERYFRKVSEGDITAESDFNFRFRYRVLANILIASWPEANADRKLLLNIGDEVFINAGREITYNMFDNNRFLTGLTFQPNTKLNFTLTHISQFGQRNSPATYEYTDMFTLAVVHKVRLHKP